MKTIQDQIKETISRLEKEQEILERFKPFQEHFDKKIENLLSNYKGSELTDHPVFKIMVHSGLNAMLVKYCDSEQIQKMFPGNDNVILKELIQKNLTSNMLQITEPKNLKKLLSVVEQCVIHNS